MRFHGNIVAFCLGVLACTGTLAAPAEKKDTTYNVDGGGGGGGGGGSSNNQAKGGGNNNQAIGGGSNNQVKGGGSNNQVKGGGSNKGNSGGGGKQVGCEAFGQLKAEDGTVVYHNNWGKADALRGKQCTVYEGKQGKSHAWSSTFDWVGGKGKVKSYSNLAVEHVDLAIKEVSKINSEWTWTMTGESGNVIDVSYDLWLSSSKGGKNIIEIMVWLAALGGAAPISDGQKTKVKDINNRDWELHKGKNGDTQVFSFVATKTINKFKGDMMEFVQYLVDKEKVPDSYYFTSLQGGIEPFEGKGTFKVEAYSLEVIRGDGKGSSKSKAGGKGGSEDKGGHGKNSGGKGGKGDKSDKSNKSDKTDKTAKTDKTDKTNNP